MSTSSRRGNAAAVAFANVSAMAKVATHIDTYIEAVAFFLSQGDTRPTPGHPRARRAADRRGATCRGTAPAAKPACGGCLLCAPGHCAQGPICPRAQGPVGSPFAGERQAVRPVPTVFRMALPEVAPPSDAVTMRPADGSVMAPVWRVEVGRLTGCPPAGIPAGARASGRRAKLYGQATVRVS